MDGIATLRETRGDERVTFGDVADHLVDFVDRDPAARDHSHENDPHRGLVGTPESEVPPVRG